MQRLPPKPRRRFSKGWTSANVVMAWVAIAAAIAMGPAMATIVVPLMVVLIASILGVYQGFGHADLRAMCRNNGGWPDSAPAPPEDQP